MGVGCAILSPGSVTAGPMWASETAVAASQGSTTCLARTAASHVSVSVP